MVKKNKNLELKDALYISMYLFAAIVFCVLFVDIAYADKPPSRLDEAIKAATDPIIKAFEDHWGKGVLLSACGAAMFGEGDGRQRALRAGAVAVVASVVALVLIAILK